MSIRGQAFSVPRSLLDLPTEKKDAKSPSQSPLSHDSKEKDTKSKDQEKKDKKFKDKSATSELGRMVVATALMGPASPIAVAPKNRDRSGSTSSERSRGSFSGFSGRSLRSSISGKSKSGASALGAHPTGLLPSALPRNSIDNSSVHSSHSQTSTQSNQSKLPFFKRLRIHSSHHDSPSSPSTFKPSKNQYTITMVPQHDIHIIWPHPVPSGNAFIAGTFPVPGHEPWEKIPMTRIPGTDQFEIHLNIQEVEDISDYVDEDGYLHHAMDHHDDDEHDQAPSSPSTPTRRRKRDVIRRIIFGRHRSASTSTTERPKDLHLDLPYHHQSKDGVIVPLTHDYKYQYKFVIDDHWQCDPSQPRVWDDKGNENHELNVTLIEQIQTSTPNRSRSSSIQSQHSVSATPDKTETSHDVPNASGEEAPASTAAAADTTTPPAEESGLSITTAPATPPPSAAPRRRKPRSVYEADFNFDERDDLSDGEGGRGRSMFGRVIRDDDYSDDDFDDDSNDNNNIINSSNTSNDVVDDKVNKADNEDQESIGKHAAEETEVVVPQQDQIPHVEPAEDVNKVDPLPAAETIPEEGAINALPIAEDPLPDTAAPQLTKEQEEEAKVEDKQEEEKVEPAVQQSQAEPSEEKRADEESVGAHVAEEPIAVEEPMGATRVEEPAVPESAPVEDKSEPFVLQAPAEIEKPNTTTTETNTATANTATTETTTTETPRLNHKASRQALEVVTDAAAAGTPYSQVPSPPLTPNSAPVRMDDLLLDGEKEDKVKQETLSREVPIPPTPQTEIPVATKFTAFTQPQAAEEDKDESAADDSETVDVLSNHDPVLDKTHHHQLKEEKHDQNTHKDRAVGKGQPNADDNLFWSLCKTTVVVSAAFVVLGMGLGRKRH